MISYAAKACIMASMQGPNNVMRQLQAGAYQEWSSWKKTKPRQMHSMAYMTKRTQKMPTSRVLFNMLRYPKISVWRTHPGPSCADTCT